LASKKKTYLRKVAFLHVKCHIMLRSIKGNFYYKNILSGVN